MNQIVLLGPQRTQPTVATAMQAIKTSGKVAVVSAGWQEREGELESLSEHLAGIDLTDLQLYGRAEKVFEDDPELHAGWRERQEWLKELQRLYRRRLRHMTKAVREMNETRGIDALTIRERADSMAMLRQLDQQHLSKIRKIQYDHWQQWQSIPRPSVDRQRQEIAAILDQCDTLLIAGGNVGVLLNRMRLFDLGPMIGRLALVAWSAGAMALSERIVLFHDFPPQGAGNTEVFDVGLSAFRGLVVFPDARRRLAMDNRKRVALLASRLQPAMSVALDEPSVLSWDGRNWQTLGPTRLLSSDGSTTAVPQ